MTCGPLGQHLAHVHSSSQGSLWDSTIHLLVLKIWSAITSYYQTSWGILSCSQTFWMNWAEWTSLWLRNLKMIQRLKALLPSKTCSTRSELKSLVRTGQSYREATSGVLWAAPAFWGQAVLQAGVFITTRFISEKFIYPNRIMSTAILFLHRRAPTKSPTDTRNSPGIYF